MKNPLVKKPETNSQNFTNSQEKYPETLEEQRDYYLKLYQKWANWQKETPEKLSEGFRTKEEFDFERIIELLQNLPEKLNGDFIEGEIFDEFVFGIIWRRNQTNFYELCDFDTEIKEIIIFLFDKSISLGNLKTGTKKLIIGKLYYKNNTVLFIEVSGNLKITCQFNSNHINLSFKDCNFSHITLENFDRGYFSPETNEYLNQMESEGKLTLINCTWSGLPILQENNRVEIPVNSNRRNFSFAVNDQTKTAFLRYFAGFQRFIQTAKGRKIGFELANKNGTIDLVIYLDNQEDLDEMTIWLEEFRNQAYQFIATGEITVDVDFDRISEYDQKLTLVEQRGRIRTLQTDLELANLKIEDMKYVILKLTQQVDELFLELQDIKKPVLCVEGEIDRDYLKFAANILGFGDLFQKVEILTLNGESELKKIWNGYNSQQFNVNNLQKKVLLIFDCDVSFPDWQQKEEKLYSWKLPKLANLIPKGIENLFDSKLVLVAKKHKNQFVDKTIQEIRGKESIKYEINSDEKRNFCNWIINRNNKTDFENFTPILVKIQEVLT